MQELTKKADDSSATSDGGAASQADAADTRWNAWLDKHSLTLPVLARETIGRVDRGLGLRLGGNTLAATTANRTYRGA